MILLDSQAFYWLVTEQSEFGPIARRKIEKSDAVYVSSISILELTLKALNQRLPDLDFSSAVTASNLKHLDFTQGDAATLRQISSTEVRDPFDKALLAQSKNNRLEFVTSDRAIISLGFDWVTDLTL